MLFLAGIAAGAIARHQRRRLRRRSGTNTGDHLTEAEIQSLRLRARRWEGAAIALTLIAIAIYLIPVATCGLACG